MSRTHRWTTVNNTYFFYIPLLRPVCPVYTYIYNYIYNVHIRENSWCTNFYTFLLFFLHINKRRNLYSNYLCTYYIYIYNYILLLHIPEQRKGRYRGKGKGSVIYVSIIRTYFIMYSKYILGERGKSSIKNSSPRQEHSTSKQKKYIYYYIYICKYKGKGINTYYM